MKRKKIPFLSCVVSPYEKIKVNMAGCNFDCEGCFALAKNEIGRKFTVDELIQLIVRSSSVIYGHLVGDVQITGGEPTTNRDYLLSLIYSLRALSIPRIGISTNGFLLDGNFARELKSLNINYIKLDIKAFDEEVHKRYTGKSNETVLRAAELLHKYNLPFYARTIHIPGLVEADQICKIAKFLSDISEDIPYKIYQFAPEQIAGCRYRKPEASEVQDAYYIARRYLKGVEYYTTKTAYKPDPYRCIEIRDDGLMEKFREIDKVSRFVIPDWDTQFLTMDRILDYR